MPETSKEIRISIIPAPWKSPFVHYTKILDGDGEAPKRLPENEAPKRLPKIIVPSREERFEDLGDPKPPKMGSITPQTVDLPHVDDLLEKLKKVTGE